MGMSVDAVLVVVGQAVSVPCLIIPCLRYADYIIREPVKFKEALKDAEVSIAASNIDI